MKKFISIVLALAMCMSLVACNSDTESDYSDINNFSFNIEDYIDDDGYFKKVNCQKYAVLPEYEGIQIPYWAHEVTEDELQAELDAIVEENTTEEQVTDRAVKDGDKLNIDYVGKIDGIPFDGGDTKGAGTDVEIGVTSYIDDFLEQLIGHMPGETFDIEVTFPEDYGKEGLNGKDAIFTVTINFIYESVAPELNDELVKEIYEEPMGWSTVEQMKASISEQLKMDKISSYIIDYLDENTVISEIPDRVHKYWCDYMVSSLKTYADMYSYTITDYLSVMGYENIEALLADYEDTINVNCRQSITIQAIGKDMKYKATEEDIVKYFSMFMGTADYKTYLDTLGQAGFMNTILPNLIVEKLAESAVLLSEADSPAKPTDAE